MSCTVWGGGNPHCGWWGGRFNGEFEVVRASAARVPKHTHKSAVGTCSETDTHRWHLYVGGCLPGLYVWRSRRGCGVWLGYGYYGCLHGWRGVGWQHGPGDIVLSTIFFLCVGVSGRTVSRKIHMKSILSDKKLCRFRSTASTFKFINLKKILHEHNHTRLCD